jgi:hypothetical protein
LGIAFFVVALHLASAPDLLAATCTRMADDFTLHDWDDPSKWDCGFVPGPDDIAVIPGPEDFFDPVANITLNDDITLRGLNVGGGRIEGDYTITVTEQMIWSGGDLHYTNTAPFESPSVIVIAPDATLRVHVDQPVMSSAGTFINHGLTLWTSGKSTITPPTLGGIGSKFINHGEFRASASNATWTVLLTNHGTLIAEPDGAETVEFSQIQNNGTVNVRQGTLSADYEQITGTTELEQATLTTATLDPILLKGGRFTGRGTFDNKIVNSGGTLAPTGILYVEGENANELLYDQGMGGTLEMRIGGTNWGSEYGSLVVRGRAEISGTLDVSFQGGFLPKVDDGFVVMTCLNECAGEFATNTSALPLNYGQTVISLGAEVAPPEPLRLPLIFGGKLLQQAGDS